MSVIGLKVGPFEIVRRAWVPGPGKWFHARGDGDPAEVLVRVVPQGGDEHRAVQHQFEVLRDLGDPRIPSPIGHYGVVPGSPSIGALAVLAATGAPLSDAIALRGDESVVMTPGTLLDLLLELAEALEQAHVRGRVHGHLDPDNVVLGPDGRVWLYGFGTAMEEEPNDAWLAPEQARGGLATPETDQWALGALALALVLGHPVWREEDPVAEAARGDASGPVEAVAQQWPALGRVLERMTDPRPHGRYPSMTAAREDLAELARIAGTRSDRRTLAALLCGRRGEASAPEEYDVVVPNALLDPPMPHGVASPKSSRALDRPSRPVSRADLEAGGAPTAVPATDSGENQDLGWPGEPEPAGEPRDLLDEPSIGSDRAAPPRISQGLSIVQLAPVLAGLMVILLVVWLILHLL